MITSGVGHFWGSPARSIYGQDDPMTCLVSGTHSRPHTFCDHTGTRTSEDGMSCRGKQSRLFVAISTCLVIFSSTVSNALPPQAITEEVQACKAISNDQQRLKCFDSLFAHKPNRTKPSERSANEDDWSIEESKSPTDGSLQIVAANLVGDTVLILRCKDQPPKPRSPQGTIISAAGLLTLRCA